TVRAFTEAFARTRERGFGDIEHGDIRVPGRQQVIHQPGCATADVDDRGLHGQGLREQAQRGGRRRLVPAGFVVVPAGVDVLPVRVTVFGLHRFLHAVYVVVVSCRRPAAISTARPATAEATEPSTMPSFAASSSAALKARLAMNS